MDEESTEPLTTGEDLPSIKQLNILLNDFLMDKRVMRRLNPYIEKVFYNPEHECYHVWIMYQTAIPLPSIQTLESVEKELNDLARIYRPYFRDGVAVSLQMN